MDLLDVLRAQKRIAPHVRHTPLVESTWLSDLSGARVWLKLESLQASNSFKSRGAFNAVIGRLGRDGPAPREIVTASAGNHGRALAAAAQRYGLKLVVFTPIDAPRAKVAAILRHGADLRAEGRDYDDAERLAKAYARDTGGEFISAYNDADVIAGAATIALELFEDAPGLDTIVVPIGGGGLISGVALASKALGRSRVVGVEVEASCAFRTSVREGRLVEIAPRPTLADGLGGNPDPDTITWPYIQRFVDQIVTVSENDLAGAIVGLAESEHLIAEGAGAAAAAALTGQRVDVRGHDVAVLVTGSNIDRQRLAGLLSRDDPVTQSARPGI